MKDVQGVTLHHRLLVRNSVKHYSGEYHVRITIGEAETSTDLTLLSDPWNDATPTDHAFLAGKLQEVTDLLNELLHRVEAVRKARGQIGALLQGHGDADELRTAAESAIRRLIDWVKMVTQTQCGTCEDEDSLPPMPDVHPRYLLDVLDRAGAPVSAGSLQRLKDLKAQWSERERELEAIISSDIADVNAWARTNGVAHVSTPGGG